MKLSHWLIATSAVISLSAGAATLTPKAGVSILYINGQESEDTIGKNTIPNGTNQVLVRMEKELGRGTKPEMFVSSPYMLTFDATGDAVVINHPVSRSVGEAKIAFKGDKPEWTITMDGKPIEYQQELLPGRTGFFPYANIGELLSQYNRQHGIQFDDSGAVSMTKVVTVAAAGSAASASSVNGKAMAKMQETATKTNKAISSEQAVDNLEQLKAWYLKSSTEERKAFRRWVIDQE